MNNFLISSFSNHSQSYDFWIFIFFIKTIMSLLHLTENLLNFFFFFHHFSFFITYIRNQFFHKWISYSFSSCFFFSFIILNLYCLHSFKIILSLSFELLIFHFHFYNRVTPFFIKKFHLLFSKSNS